MSLNLPKWLLNLTANLHFSKYPMFMQYSPAHHKIKGFEVRSVIDVVEAGDILLRKYQGYLNDQFTPGFFSHGALYAGIQPIEYEGVTKEVPCIIHAIGEGVVKEDILDFCRTDCLVVLRPKVSDDDKMIAINSALELETERVGYDYVFAKDNGTVYCTELVDICYNGLFIDDYQKQISGHDILLPDGIYRSEFVSIVKEIRH